MPCVVSSLPSSQTILEWSEYIDDTTKIVYLFNKEIPSFEMEQTKYSNFHVESDKNTYWNLVVENVSDNDEGIYVCMASQGPDLLISQFHFDVIGKCTAHVHCSLYLVKTCNLLLKMYYSLQSKSFEV